MLLRNTFHTTYCTNIHPGGDWDTTFSALEKHLVGIRNSVAPGMPFGLGLRLSDKASRELGLGERLADFRRWLDARDIYVFTMNGFPFGTFHGQPVKDRVHEPDWTTPERLAYTRRLFDQLSFLLPQGGEGGISTSPVSYRHWFATPEKRVAALKSGARNMAQVAMDLIEKERETGQYLHLDIEPEPDGLLENSADVLEYYRDYLLPEGISLLSERLGMPEGEARSALLRHITICYDICHFALAFEGPETVFGLLAEQGIQVGKIQVSAALRIRADKSGREDALRALAEFNEPVYLHQVTQLTPAGVRTWPDLPDLLAAPPEFGELRAHFHVPIFAEGYGVLGATQQEILEVLAYLAANPVCRHLEVETYTWEVLPAGLKEDLAASISRELLWLRNALEA
ncbi:metabolite traffic protein EboE [Robiginitalea sp. SC105]|uniref:metabolite traffic protein EboE n=1 Tax=Robiginitalea sp. SC105 TaxID=2762332 RepID=UPI00163AE881|nr:metabolite traffic protein EboE [Robiginitalea sp. SC105]MBC2840217.1 metabolite traffic protein EboE [Robiginitalea sp. SC105]